MKCEIELVLPLPQAAGPLCGIGGQAVDQEAGLDVGAADVPADHAARDAARSHRRPQPATAGRHEYSACRIDRFVGKHKAMLSTHPVQVIPVLDLLDGRVVRAVRGDRAAYRPIVSTLAAGSEPLTVARALLDRCATPGHDAVLYVADLDAIQGREAHVATLQRLLEQLPDLTLWLDAGFADAQQAQALCRHFGAAAGRVRAVFGS